MNQPDKSSWGGKRAGAGRKKQAASKPPVPVKSGHGGARPNSGAKPKEPVKLELSVIYDDPDKFLKAVMNDSGSDAKLRVDAAKALLSAKVRQAENGGKKEAKVAAAKKIASKFASAAPPRLAAVGGKRT